MTTDYQYWQSKKSGEILAVKLKNGQPIRYCGPLQERQYKAPDGRLLHLKLEVFHYGFYFEDDPHNYVVCDA